MSPLFTLRTVLTAQQTWHIVDCSRNVFELVDRKDVGEPLTLSRLAA